MADIDDDPDICTYCGAVVPEHAWVGIEVQRPVEIPGSDVDWVDYDGGTFCSQEHAARWLDQPLPPPQPPTEIGKSGLMQVGGVDWVLVGLGAIALVLVVFMGIGMWTVSGWILH